MQQLSLQDTLGKMICPSCFEGQLQEITINGHRQVACDRCDRAFGMESEVMDFVMADRLHPTNQNEISGNTIDLTDEHVVQGATCKGDDNPIYMWQMNRTARLMVRMMAPYGEETTLHVIGTGTGFDLKLLLKHRCFRQVLASDISLTKTTIVPRTLVGFEGELGVYACEFRHCPVRKERGNLGLVFQALHHAPDAHAALERLLDNNFANLLIVEPITNWLVEILAALGLAKRTEYSGVTPDWMSLRRIRRIAADRAYSVDVVTWWELPPVCCQERLRRRPLLWKPMCWAVGVVCRLTSLFNFGCMAAIHLRAREDDPAPR